MEVLKILKAIYEILRDNLKLAIKRKFCKHSYEWKLTSFRGGDKLEKCIVANYDFKCVKCGKYLSVKMDRDKQVEGTEYVSCLIKEKERGNYESV